MFHTKCDPLFFLPSARILRFEKVRTAARSPLFLRTERTIPKLVTPLKRGWSDVMEAHCTGRVMWSYPTKLNLITCKGCKLSNVG